MRILGLGIVMGAMMLTSCSKELSTNEIPSVVYNSFKTEYPNAMEAEWEQNNEYFDVEFDVDGVEHEVQLDSSGEIMLKKEEIMRDELPQQVNDAISTDFANEEIDDIERISKDGKTYYEVEFGGTFKDNVLIFDSSGNIASNVNS